MAKSKEAQGKNRLDPFSFSQQPKPKELFSRETRSSFLSTEIRPQPAVIRKPLISTEIAIGETLLNQTLDAVNTACENIIPTEFHSRIRRLLVSDINFHKKRKEIPDFEKEMISHKPQHIREALMKSGLSSTAINRMILGTDITHRVPIYWTGQDKDATLYIPTDVKSALSYTAPSRTSTSMQLGFALIEHIVETMPAVLDLGSLPWKNMAINKLKNFFFQIREGYESGEKDYSGLKVDELNIADRQLQTMIENEGTQFIAKGARIYVILPGQDIDTVELNLGSVFNADILVSLSEAIVAEFTRLMQRTNEVVFRFDERHKQNVLDVLNALGLSPDRLWEYFAGSFLPDAFEKFSNSHIAPVQKRMEHGSIDALFKSLSSDNSSEAPLIDPTVYPE